MEKLGGFYEKCLEELKARPNWSETFVPILKRYVTITEKLAALDIELQDEEVTVTHTNKIGAQNSATSPKWRMFLELDAQAVKLARALKLSPESAPVGSAKEKKKGFDVGGKMKIA